MSERGRSDEPKLPERHEGPPRTSPHPTSRLAPRYDLVDVARAIQESDATLRLAVGSKLQVIADQIRALQEEARSLLEGAHRDAELHRAECTLQKRPGHIYHLYRRPDGRAYFSMLSPAEWGESPPHPHEGSYRLEPDMSFTPVSEMAARDEAESAIRRLLANKPEER